LRFPGQRLRRPPHASGAAGSQPAGLLILGDSLTVGEHASRRDGTYVETVLASLAAGFEPGLATRVEAISGGRLRDLLNRRPMPGQHLVVVELGTNDWHGYLPNRPWRSTPTAEFARDYARLLDQVVGPGARLVCLGIWGPPGASSETGARLDDYDAVAASECRSRGGRFLPLSDLYADPFCRGPAGRWTPFGTSDNTHPNDRGHQRVAERVLAGLATG